MKRMMVQVQIELDAPDSTATNLVSDAVAEAIGPGSPAWAAAGLDLDLDRFVIDVSEGIPRAPRIDRNTGIEEPPFA